MKRLRVVEIAVLGAVVVSQAVLFARPIHSATSYDEAVYLAALDALRHGQALGSQVFAAQFPGFYDLLRGISYLTGVAVTPVRAGMLAVTLLGTVGGWLIGRRFGGPIGGCLVAALMAIAPPLDLFGYQVIADTPMLALTAAALGVATLPGSAAAVAGGALFGVAFSVKLTALTAGPAAIWLLWRRLRPAFAGFAAVLIALIAAHAHALADLWRSGVTYHEQARSTPAVMPHPHSQIFNQIPHTTPFFALALLAVLTLLVSAIAERKLPDALALWSWVALALAFLFIHKPLHENHLIEFPFTLAVASGATLGAAIQRQRHSLRHLLAVALAVIVATGFVQQWRRTGLALAREPASNIQAAHALERLTPPGALVVDDRPIIAFLAHRLVVGQLVDLARLRFESGSLDDHEVMQDLSAADAVVVSRSLRDRPAILSYVRAHFRLRYRAANVQIWVRQR